MSYSFPVEQDISSSPSPMNPIDTAQDNVKPCIETGTCGFYYGDNNSVCNFCLFNAWRIIIQKYFFK